VVNGSLWEEKVIPLSTLLAATTPRPAGTQYAADHDYWLAQCEGFRALSDDGDIGVVEHVGYRSSPTRAAFLLVRGGMLGTRSVVIGVDDVREVDARRRTVRLCLGYRQTALAAPRGLRFKLRHHLIPASLLRRAHP
jgi:hypothetical protein